MVSAPLRLHGRHVLGSGSGSGSDRAAPGPPASGRSASGRSASGRSASGRSASGRSASGRPASGRGWTLATVSIATFMLMLDLTVVNVALPDLRTAFDASFSQLQWVLDAYALGLAVFLLTAGSLADRFGRKRVFNLGFVIFIVGSLACGAAPGADWLSLARGLQGLGGAILFAVGPALIGHEYRGPDRSTAFGVFGGVVGLAIAFGPLIGGLITENLSWRWIFLINVPVGLAALLAGLLRMRESSDLIARPVDRWGLVTFSGALGLLVLGFLRGEASGWSSPLIIGMFGASALLFAGFYAIERALGPNAMLDLSLFANVTFNGLSAVTLLNAAATMSAIFLQISYVQNVLGYSAWQAGLRFLPLTLTLFLAAAVAGGLTAKVPPRLLVGLSLTAIAGGLALVTRVTATSDWTALLPSMIVLGLGMGLFNPPRAALSISVVEPAKAGMASGIGETFQQVGVAVGIAAFGALFHARASHLFAHSAAGLALGPEAGSFGDAVAAGGGTPAAARVSPAPLAAQLDLAGRTAFTDGLREVMIVCALVAAVGAVIAFGFIRSRDLHDSAAGLEERTRI